MRDKLFLFQTAQFTFIICLFLNFSSYANFNQDAQTEYWTIQQTPTTNNLFSCSFSDNLNGWAVGEWGTIIHTSDGGSNWILQNDGLSYPFVSVAFINNNKGWIVGNSNLYSDPVILSTTNGGLNWQYFYYPDTTKIFRTICFADSLSGYIGTYGGVIIRTTNGGNNWTEIQSDSNFISRLDIKKFAFFNNKTGLAVGGMMDIAGFIRKTTNYGLNWLSEPVSGEPLNDVKFIDSNYIIGVGGDFEFGSFLYKTNNFGINFSINYFPSFGLAYTISPRTKSEFWISMGFTNKLLLTKDSGNSFIEIPSPGNSSVYDIIFEDSLNGWCVGTGGVVAKYNNSTVGISKDYSTIQNKTFILYQNFPNPFNPSTKIKFTILQGKSGNTIFRNASLKIYEITGKEISSLINQRLASGEYEIEFNSNNLSGGIYFYKLSVDDFIETRKMVMIK